jgi:aromatic ring-opening dioxygenase catalytic subunit (LigB family)
MASETQARLPVLFIPHGGGPCFFMPTPPGWPPDLWDRMAAYLRGIRSDIGVRPRALLVISGHWEAPRATVNAAAHPPLYYDYFGFPEHTYHLAYPAPGAPDLAHRVRALLADAGIAADEETTRGLDHGVFVPLMLAFPDADIPVVQLSMVAGLDPARHLALGRALGALRAEGVLIIGSGMSYHNLRALIAGPAAATRGNEEAAAFDAWLVEAVSDADPERRAAKLCGWEQAPGARAAHPHPDHLLPLMVAAGAAGADRGRQVYSDRILGKAVSGFQFG